MGYFDPLLPKIDTAVRDHSLSARDTLARLDTLQIEAAELAIAANGAPHYEEANTTPGLPDLLHHVWQTLLDLAQEDEGEHERLLALVKEMKADAREPGWTCWKEPASWARMSLFGMAARDKLNGPRIDAKKPDDEDALAREEVQAVLAGADLASVAKDTPVDPVLIAAHTARTRWLALHCFLALLWASADVDESLHALWATRDGLEFSPSSPGRPGSAALGPRALRVETACVWLVRAGKQMYAAKGIWGPRGDDGWDTKKGAPGKGGELWDGVDGYDKGRWAVWKKSLEDIINERDVGTNVVEAAKAALAAMKQAEGPSS